MKINGIFRVASKDEIAKLGKKYFFDMRGFACYKSHIAQIAPAVHDRAKSRLARMRLVKK